MDLAPKKSRWRCVSAEKKIRGAADHCRPNEHISALSTHYPHHSMTNARILGILVKRNPSSTPPARPSHDGGGAATGSDDARQRLQVDGSTPLGWRRPPRGGVWGGTGSDPMLFGRRIVGFRAFLRIRPLDPACLSNVAATDRTDPKKLCIRRFHSRRPRAGGWWGYRFRAFSRPCLHWIYTANFPRNHCISQPAAQNAIQVKIPLDPIDLDRTIPFKSRNWISLRFHPQEPLTGSGGGEHLRDPPRRRLH